jgi:Mrp family chromosome partitioning ATPase/capsular polysaccharide biosynthesis protein
MPPISTASASEEQSIPTGRFQPLASLLKHKWLMLFIMMTVCLIGIPMSSQMGKMVYTAFSVVLVSPRFVPYLNEEKEMYLNRTDYQLYVKQQTSMVKRSDVLEDAWNMPDIQKIWLLPDETQKDGLARLKEALKAENKRGNPFISITLKTEYPPSGLDIVLNAVVKSFLDKSQQETIFDSSGRIEVLQQRRQELERDMDQKHKRRTEIAEQLGVTTFKENSLNPYDEILIDSTKAHQLARRQRVEAQTRLKTLTSKQKNGNTLLKTLVNEMVTNDSVLRSYKAKLIERRTELLTQILGLTAKHPSYRRAQQEITKIDQDIKQATQQLYQELYHQLLAKDQSAVYQARRLEQALADELKRQRAQSNEYATFYNEALENQREIDRATRQLNKIDDKIDYLSLESNAPGFVRLNTAAKKVPPSGGRRKVFLMFVMVAFSLGIGIPILIDLFDKRIQTPGEVHKILGFAPLTWILDRHDQKTEQFAMDHLRRMALALERDWHTHETTGFVLTSVKPGAGTTTLTLELAHILSDLGVRTLALELNAFKPDSRYSDGMTSAEGLSSFLIPDDFQPTSPELLIRTATSELPDRLPVGMTSKRHLITHGKLRAILKQLNEHYDLILMDTPPLLLSADAELLGEIAGGVLLVIEASSTMPGELKRAAQLLERLNPPVVGTILNRVKIFKGGGYFAKLLKEYETGTKLQPGFLKRLFFK